MKSPPRTIFDFVDIVEYLRCSLPAGGRTSRAALARRLGYRSPRTIGMVLDGTRCPSAKLLGVLSRALDHTSDEERYFRLLSERKRRLDRRLPTTDLDVALAAQNPKRLAQTPIQDDAFRMIAEWYHLPIKELVATPGFRASPSAIARRLRGKVSLVEARVALERLARLGLIRRRPTGEWEKSVAAVTTLDGVPSAANRRHHRQMMERAAEALEEQPMVAREISSLTILIDSARLAEAKEYLANFREAFRRRFSAARADGVYQLNLQLFEHTTRAKRSSTSRGAH